MERDDQQGKLVFTTEGAWLGLVAYIMLFFIIATVYLG